MASNLIAMPSNLLAMGSNRDIRRPLPFVTTFWCIGALRMVRRPSITKRPLPWSISFLVFLSEDMAHGQVMGPHGTRLLFKLNGALI